MTLRRTHHLALAAATVLTLGLLAGCGGGDDGGGEAAGGEGSSESEAATPGEGSCDFADLDDPSAGAGTATLTETGDAYEVTWSGQPPAGTGRSVYAVNLLDDGGTSLSLQLTFEDGTPDQYGVTDESATLTPVDGEPQSDGDTVTGSFPKATKGLDGFTPSQWNANVTLLEEDVSAYCNDGAALPFEPLG